MLAFRGKEAGGTPASSGSLGSPFSERPVTPDHDNRAQGPHSRSHPGPRNQYEYHQQMMPLKQQYPHVGVPANQTPPLFSERVALKQSMSYGPGAAMQVFPEKSFHPKETSGAALSGGKKDPVPTFSAKPVQDNLNRIVDLVESWQEEACKTPQPEFEGGSSTTTAVNTPYSPPNRLENLDSDQRSAEDFHSAITTSSQQKRDTSLFTLSTHPKVKLNIKGTTMLGNAQGTKSKRQHWSTKMIRKMIRNGIAKSKTIMTENETTRPQEMDAVESSRKVLDRIRLPQTPEMLLATQVFELPLNECQSRGQSVVYRPSSGTTYHTREQISRANPILQEDNSLRPLGSKCVAHPGIQLAEKPAGKSIGTQTRVEPNSELDQQSVNELLCAAEAKMQARLVQQISQMVLGITQAAQNSVSGNGSSNSAGNASGSSNGEGSSSRHPGEKNLSKKRTRYVRRGGQDQDEESENSDNERRKKGKCKAGAEDGAPRRRLKCPYFQWRSEEYPLASCRGQGFADMAKLKDHLKRVHTQPLRCSRCWEEVLVFDEHWRKNVVCEKRPEPHDRLISPQKLQELNFNRSPFTKSMSVEEKWCTLYRILFPEEKHVPSPYEQYGLSSQFEKLLILTLEEEIIKELGDVLGNIIDIIRERLPAIVSHCKEKTLTLSRESRMTLSDGHLEKSSSSDIESVFDKPEGTQSASKQPSIGTDEFDLFSDMSAIPLGCSPGIQSSAADLNFFDISKDGSQVPSDAWSFVAGDDWDSMFGPTRSFIDLGSCDDSGLRRTDFVTSMCRTTRGEKERGYEVSTL